MRDLGNGCKLDTEDKQCFQLLICINHDHMLQKKKDPIKLENMVLSIYDKFYQLKTK